MVSLPQKKFSQRKYLLVLSIGILSILLVFLASSVLAKPAEEKTYVGSAKCKECHDRIFSTWKKTLHAQVIQDVRKKPSAIKGDFTLLRRKPRTLVRG